MDADKLAAARARRAKGESPTQIATALGVSRASVYRAPPRPGRRPPKVLTPARERQARRMLVEGATKDEIASVVGVSVSTLYRRLNIGGAS